MLESIRTQYLGSLLMKLSQSNFNYLIATVKKSDCELRVTAFKCTAMEYHDINSTSVYAFGRYLSISDRFSYTMDISAHKSWAI